MMFSAEFIDYITDAIDVGNRMFSNDARRFVYAHNKDYYQLVNFDDDRVFLESLLLSYFLDERKDTTLDQILFTSLPEDREKEVCTDEKGIVYIPRLGYFSTGIANETIRVAKNAGNYILTHDEKVIPFTFIPLNLIPGTSVEIPPYRLPYAQAIFDEVSATDPVVEVEHITEQHADKVKEAFAILQENFPVYYHWLMKSMTKIQVFKNPAIWSFAAVKSYGISYLSAHERRSILFFLEDILHQCAHNIFFAVTYFERNQLFNIPPESNLDAYTQDGDHRDIYGVFHGLFTQSCISIFFDICLEKGLFSDEEKFEVIGRLSDNMKRWEKMISVFSNDGIFTETGEQFFAEFKDIYEALHEKYKDTINGFDTSNQPYIFCFDKFLEANRDKLYA